MKNLMSNFSGFAMSRVEMKKVTGGVTCSFLTGDGAYWEGSCASSDVNQCFGYAGQQAAAFNKDAGYPGISYECH